MKVEGKVALVTGAGRGIGQAVAVGLARAGAAVAVNDLDEAAGGQQTVQEIVALGGKARFFRADVSLHDEVRAMVEDIVSTFGGLHILVNNAMIVALKPTLELSVAEWRRIIDVNLTGYFICAQVAARQMVQQGQGGKIINFSSVTRCQPVANLLPYVVSKAGIDGLTRALALELAHHRIHVNQIAPGATDTPSNAPFFTPAVRARYNERIPLARIAQPTDMVGAVVFLASDESNYITGQEIVVDGGLTINGEVGHGKG